MVTLRYLLRTPMLMPCRAVTATCPRLFDHEVMWLFDHEVVWVGRSGDLLGSGVQAPPSIPESAYTSVPGASPPRGIDSSRTFRQDRRCSTLGPRRRRASVCSGVL